MGDALRDMQKDTFNIVLIITWLLSVVYMTFASLSSDLGLEGVLVWVIITSLNLTAHRLSHRHFRLSTWLWVIMLVLMLAVKMHPLDAFNSGVMPELFTLLVIISGLLISSRATFITTALVNVLMIGDLIFTHSLNFATLFAIIPPLLMMWTTATLIWILSDQLVTALEWETFSQKQLQVKAEELRISRDELRKSLDLRDELHARLREAYGQLETSIAVGQRITSILELDSLLEQVVDLIEARYKYYFVGVFLCDGNDDHVTLHAGTGEAGRLLSQQRLQLPIGQGSIVGSAVADRTPTRVVDVLQDERYSPVDLLPRARSELALPLVMGENVLGVLDIESDRTGTFLESDVPVLQLLANQVAIAIHNASLYHSEQTRRHLAEMLYNVSRALSSTLNMAEVLDVILVQLDKIVSYDRALVLLEDNRGIRPVAAQGFPPGTHPLRMRIFVKEGDVYHQIYQTKEPLTVADVLTERPDWQHVDDLPQARAWLGVPLIRGDEVIGMLSLTRETVTPYQKEETNLAASFAGQAAIAIENARLYEEIKRFNLELEDKVRERTEELQQAYDQLERIDRTKSDFIDVTAHELRTPLTIVKGFAQVLQTHRALVDAPDAGTFLNKILENVDRLHQIVNTMLDVVKMDSEALDLRKEPTDIVHIITGIQSGFTVALRERNLTLKVADLEKLPRVSADPDLLNKVFYQVLVNAIKYTPDGGEITVLGNAIHDAQLGDAVEIIIRDTGIGIDPEHHELIFEKFYQTGDVALHSSGQTKFKGGGAGLGLAIARGIIEAHGGRIWVDSPGYDEKNCPGSQFHVVLPQG